MPCAKQAPEVRDVFSEAFGVKNRLFRYGRDIRYRKKASCGTRCVFQGFPVHAPLLWYGIDIRVVREAAKRPPGRNIRAQNDHRGKTTPEKNNHQGTRGGGHNIQQQITTESMRNRGDAYLL